MNSFLKRRFMVVEQFLNRNIRIIRIIRIISGALAPRR